MSAGHQDALVGSAKHRCGHCNIKVICRGGPMGRHPQHFICTLPQQVERLLSVVLVSAPDTRNEIVIVPALAKLLQGKISAHVTISC